MITNFAEESELFSLFPTNKDSVSWIISNTYTSSDWNKFDSSADYLGNNISSVIDKKHFNIDEILLLESSEKTPRINKGKDDDKDILTGREMSAVKSDSLLGGNSDDLASVIVPPKKTKKEDDIVEEIPLLADDILTHDSSLIQIRNAYDPANIVNDPNLTLEITKSSDSDINAITGKGDNPKKWNLDYLGNQVTYGFVVGGGDGYYNQDILSSYEGDGLAYELTDDGKNTVRSALNDLEEIIPVDFVETSYSYKNPPLMVFLGVQNNENVSYASLPNDYFRHGGDVFLNNDYQDHYGTVAHEIGHALGLQHGVKAGKSDVEPFLSPSKAKLTIMGGGPTEYGSIDVKTLQYLYGSNEIEEIAPKISIGNVSIKEGDRTKKATFKVTLDTPATQTVQVDYETVSDTAWSGFDYRYKSGTITFKPGQKTKKIKVPIYGDNFNGGDRGFWVNLTNPRDAEINDGWGYGSIIEDDFAVTPSIKINDISIIEGDYRKNATFKVTLDTRATQRVKVDYETIDDTAWSGYDYRYKSGTITFKPGQKTKKIKVPIYGDNYYEGDLEFWIKLSNPRNAEINSEDDQWGHAWILEDDF